MEDLNEMADVQLYHVSLDKARQFIKDAKKKDVENGEKYSYRYAESVEDAAETFMGFKDFLDEAKASKTNLPDEIKLVLKDLGLTPGKLTNVSENPDEIFAFIQKFGSAPVVGKHHDDLVTKLRTSKFVEQKVKGYHSQYDTVSNTYNFIHRATGAEVSANEFYTSAPSSKNHSNLSIIIAKSAEAIQAGEDEIDAIIGKSQPLSEAIDINNVTAVTKAINDVVNKSAYKSKIQNNKGSSVVYHVGSDVDELDTYIFDTLVPALKRVFPTLKVKLSSHNEFMFSSNDRMIFVIDPADSPETGYSPAGKKGGLQIVVYKEYDSLDESVLRNEWSGVTQTDMKEFVKKNNLKMVTDKNGYIVAVKPSDPNKIVFRWSEDDYKLYTDYTIIDLRMGRVK